MRAGWCISLIRHDQSTRRAALIFNIGSSPARISSALFIEGGELLIKTLKRMLEQSWNTTGEKLIKNQAIQVQEKA